MRPRSNSTPDISNEPDLLFNGPIRSGGGICVNNSLDVRFVCRSEATALAFYGIAETPQNSPNTGNGRGRAVGEIQADGTFGPIYYSLQPSVLSPTGTLGNVRQKNSGGNTWRQGMPFDRRNLSCSSLFPKVLR